MDKFQKKILLTNMQKSAGIAAILTIIIPGAGHMYVGHVIKGIIYLFIVLISMVAFPLVGLLLYVCILIDAIVTVNADNKRLYEELECN